MLTNYLLNQNNILSTFRAQEDKRTNKYLEEQENIVENFNRVLIDKVSKLLITQKEYNFTLAIKQSLYYLWNASWSLGTKHSNNEIGVKFTSSSELITFGKKEDEEKRLRELIDARRKFDDTYTNKDGSYNLRAYLRDKGYRGSITPEQEQRFISELNRDKNRLESKIQEQIVKVQEVDNKQQRQRIERTPTQRQQRTTSQRSTRNNTNTQPPKLPVRNRDVVETIQKKREKEIQYGVDTDIPALEQSEFGKVYLDKRFNVISTNLSNRYITAFKSIIPQYVKSNDQLKDVRLAQRISKYVLEDRQKEIRDVDERIALVNARFLKNKQSKAYLKNKTEYLATLDGKEYDLAFRQRYEEPRATLLPVERETLVGLDKRKTSYTRKDLTDYVKQQEQLRRTLQDTNNSTKRIALTEITHAYNLGRLDTYLKRGITKVKFNNSLENAKRTASIELRKKYQYLAKQYNVPYKIKGIICPVCQERASRGTEHGKGVYLIEDVLNNPQLHISLHPYCFPGDTQVTGLIAKSATGRYYEGDIIVIKTSSGKHLTVTPKHPILTNKGWIAAENIVEKSYVFSASDINSVSRFIAPNDYQAPASIEQVFTTLAKSSSMSTTTMPITTEYFHGDFGIGSNVNVVYPNSFLNSSTNINTTKHIPKSNFITTTWNSINFISNSSFTESFPRPSTTFSSFMSFGNLITSFFISHSQPVKFSSFREISNLNVINSQNTSNIPSRNLEMFCNFFNRFSTQEHLTSSIGINGIFTLTKSIYSTFFQDRINSFDINSETLCELFSGNSAIILPDQVISVDRKFFSGHVYNLETKENWYLANSIVVHNCACFYSPVKEDDDDDDKKKRRKKKVKKDIDISDLFNNNVAKWAAGGTIAILGTTLMYAMFRRTRPVLPGGAAVRQPVIDTTIKKILTPKQEQQILQQNVQQLLADNKEEILNLIQTGVPLLPIPLPQLKPIVKLPENAANIEPQKEVVNEALKQESRYASPTSNTIATNIQNNIAVSINLNNQVRASNPDVSTTLKPKLEAINNRIRMYQAYDKSFLSKAERATVIRQYREDLKLLQTTINEIQDNNFKLAAQYNTLYKLHEEAYDVANRNLANVANAERIIVSTPIVSSLRSTLDELDDTLRRNVSLQQNGFLDNLVANKERILANQDLQLDYLRYSARNLSRSVDKIPLKGLTEIEKQLDKTINLINNLNIDELRYEGLMLSLENINIELAKRADKLSKLLLDIDINLIIAANKKTKMYNNAIIISEYKERIKQLQNQLFLTTNLLSQKKP